MCREKLREQHALGEEIANAITSAPIGEPVDEDELNEELDALEQEQLDNKMLKTGTVPVSDDIQRLPAAANGESKCCKVPIKSHVLSVISQGQDTCPRGRGRGGRTPEITGGDGDLGTAYSAQVVFSVTQFLYLGNSWACIWWVAVMQGNIGLPVVRLGVFRRLIKFSFLLRQAFQTTSAVHFTEYQSSQSPTQHGSEVVAHEVVMQSISCITWNDAAASGRFRHEV